MNMKFRISSPEQSERLQTVLLAQGYGWPEKVVRNRHGTEIYAYPDSKIITYSNDEQFFKTHRNTEQDTEAFIAEHAPKQPEANEWRENTGTMPVEAHIEVDVELRDAASYTGGAAAGGYSWSILNERDDIIKWRFHNAEDEAAYTTKAQEPMCVKEQPSGEFSGGNVNYYLLSIDNPKRLSPYECEAEDIIEALNMTFAEGNVFKALWRSCAMRVRGHGKAGQDEHGVYDGDKIAYYGGRVKVQRRRKAGEEEVNWPSWSKPINKDNK